MTCNLPRLAPMRPMLLLTWLSLVYGTAQELVAQTQASPQPQQHAEWHHHLGGPALPRALELVKNPPAGDTVSSRVSGVWWDRSNYNLWRNVATAGVASAACLVHGFIDESNQANIPRFKFVGNEWRADSQAIAARAQVLRAFAEWSALEVDRNTANADSLRTGLEFRAVHSDSAAEIEIRWKSMDSDVAAAISRSMYQSGLTTRTTLTFNSANRWAFGAAATTSANQMHFYSTALHEIGHIIGLWESRDTTSVMMFRRLSGPNGPSFDRIDPASRRAALALYSRPANPVPGAPAEGCLQHGLITEPLVPRVFQVVN